MQTSNLKAGPLVSIIVTTYNRRDSVCKTIESVLAQEYTPVEIIVVDDGSVDGTAERVRELFGDSVVLVALPKNQGSSNARNTGILKASGEYFIVWDSDDFLYPHCVSALMTAAHQRPDAVTISAPTNVFLRGEEVDYPRLSEGYLSLEQIVCAKMPKYKMVRMSKTIVRSQVAYRGKNLDFMFNNELRAQGEWFHIKDNLGKHFLNSDLVSLTRARRKPNVAHSILRAPFLYEHLLRFKDVYLGSCPVRYADYAYGAALGFILAQDLVKAKEMAEAAQTFNPCIRNRVLCVLSGWKGAPFLVKVAFRVRATRL